MRFSTKYVEAVGGRFSSSDLCSAVSALRYLWVGLPFILLMACGDQDSISPDPAFDATSLRDDLDSGSRVAPVSWWGLDEGSGATASDRVGDNHGQLLPDEANGPTWTAAGSEGQNHDCPSGGCLLFSGTGDGVACGDDASLALESDITISLWFSPNSWNRVERLFSNGMYEIMHRGEWAGDKLYFLYRIDTRPPRGDSVWDYKAGVHSNRAFGLGKWHHLVAIKRAGDMEIWVDGVRASLAKDLFDETAVSPDHLGALNIGNGPEPFSGFIDEPKVYDRALSPQEICTACRQHAAQVGVQCCEPQCVHDSAACTQTACSDGVDNDDDGLVDANDPGCTAPSDTAETLQPGGLEGASISALKEDMTAFYNNAYGRNNGIIDTFPYNLSRPLAGLVSMYEATQDPSFIELALRNVEAVFDKLVDVDNDGYLEWTFGPSLWDHDHTPDTPMRASCLYTQKSAKHFARVVRVIQHSDELRTRYGARAAALVTLIKTHIVNDPHCKPRFMPGYSSVHHIVAHPVGVLLELYLLEGDGTYLQGHDYTYLSTITAQATSLKNTLFAQQDDPRALAWGSTACVDLASTYPDCYFVGSEYPPCRDSQSTVHCRASDVSHANEFVYTVIALYRAGIVFSRGDIDAFTYTFMNKVWDADLAFPNWRDFVDGRNEPPGGRYGPWILGTNIAPGWVGLGAFDRELQRVLETAYTSPRTNGQAPTSTRYIAFCGELARNRIAGDCQYTNRGSEIADGRDNDCNGRIDD